MNITAAASTNSENASGSSRIVPYKAEGMALPTGFIFQLAFIIVGNLLTIVPPCCSKQETSKEKFVFW